MFTTLPKNDPTGAEKAMLTEDSSNDVDRFELVLIGAPNFHTADDLQAAGWRVDIARTAGRCQIFYTWDGDLARHAAGRLGIGFTRAAANDNPFATLAASLAAPTPTEPPTNTATAEPTGPATTVRRPT